MRLACRAGSRHPARRARPDLWRQPDCGATKRVLSAGFPAVETHRMDSSMLLETDAYDHANAELNGLCRKLFRFGLPCASPSWQCALPTTHLGLGGHSVLKRHHPPSLPRVARWRAFQIAWSDRLIVVITRRCDDLSVYRLAAGCPPLHGVWLHHHHRRRPAGRPVLSTSGTGRAGPTATAAATWATAVTWSGCYSAATNRTTLSGSCAAPRST